MLWEAEQALACDETLATPEPPAPFNFEAYYLQKIVDYALRSNSFMENKIKESDKNDPSDDSFENEVKAADRNSALRQKSFEA